MGKGIGALGLIFGLAFMGLAILQFLDLQADFTGLGNGVGTLADNMPTLYIVIAAAVFVIGVGGALYAVLKR